MQVIKPTPSQAAFVLKKFLEEHGVSMKLSKTQDAVARMQGYANWNALASEIDPKVGTPNGCLRQDDTKNYTLLSGKQSAVFITIQNVQVSVKHDDEGVVVDVFSKQGLQNGEESLGSTWVTFAEAEGEEDTENSKENTEDSEGSLSESRNRTTDDLLRSLLTAVSVQDSASGEALPLSNVDVAAIRKELRGGGTVDTDKEIASYYDGARTVSVTLRKLLNASPMGAEGWLLPDGTEFLVHQPEADHLDDHSFDHDAAKRKHETSADLLRLLLTANKAKDAVFGKGTSPTYKNEDLIRKALASKPENSDLEATVFEFRGANGLIQLYSLAELLKAVPNGASGWRLSEGRILFVWSIKS
jgi:hypothetical protein